MKLIIIAGNSRSGTTVIGEVLASAAKSRLLPELHYFENLVDLPDIKNGLSTQKRARVAETLISRAFVGIFGREFNSEWDKQAVSNLHARVLDRLDDDMCPISLYESVIAELGDHFNVNCLVDQTGKNVFFLDEISEIKNLDTYILYMCRNPVDVMRSQASKWKVRGFGVDGLPLTESLRALINFNPILEALVIRNVGALIEKGSDSLPTKLVRYEDLVNDSKNVLRELSEYTGLGALTQDHLKMWGSSHSTSDFTGLRPTREASKSVGFREAGIDLWVVIFLSTYCDRFGYQTPSVNWKSVCSGLIWGLILVPQSIFIGLFNLARMPNVFVAFRRRVAGK